MPTIKMSDLRSKYEDIVVEDEDGKQYVISKVTSEMIAEATSLNKENMEDSDIKESSSVLDRQLGIFLSADPSEFSGLDIRWKRDIVRFITDTLNDQIGGKGDEGKESDSDADVSEE